MKKRSRELVLDSWKKSALQDMISRIAWRIPCVRVKGLFILPALPFDAFIFTTFSLIRTMNAQPGRLWSWINYQSQSDLPASAFNDTFQFVSFLFLRFIIHLLATHHFSVHNTYFTAWLKRRVAREILILLLIKDFAWIKPPYIS